MARHVTPRLKVVSSGRLTGSGRGQMTRKKAAGRPLHLDPSYSLYSTDSEDQVITINRGLDRCATLLSNILQAEKTADAKTKSQISKAAPCKKKTSLYKNEAEKKRVGKKASAVACRNKRPALVQKTILPSQACAGLRGQACARGVQKPSAVDVIIGSEVKPGDTSVTQVECVQPRSFPLGSSLPSTGSQPSTVFNCRLTTSTPALSPHGPTSAQSQSPHRGADGETHHFTQQLAGASAAPSTQHRALSAAVTSAQYTASFSVAPAIQVRPAVSTAVSAVQSSSPVLIGPHAGSVGQSEPQISPSPLASARIPTLVPLPTHILVCDSSEDQQLSSGECVSSLSEESGDCMSEEDELDRVDTMPVRDTSCQSSIDKRAVMLKHKSKSGSPEKTARKVLTVKYLLGELKALVANQDSEAVRLISEVEQSISLLPAMVGSTNIQAELALALQPLRSENVQLRRRLRILNQQLQERERAERQARPVDCHLELVSLQSLNHTLQTQLNDRQRELENLQQENQKLQQAVEDKEKDLEQTKEQCELETSRIRMDVSEALAEMRNCQAKLEDSEREKTALTHSLQQKEAEITKLQELIRNLQKSPIPCYPAQTDVSRPPAAQLTKSVLDQYENQQREPALANRVTDSVTAYLQTLKDSEHSSPPHSGHPQTHEVSHSSLGQWKRTQESSPKISDVHTSLKNTIVSNVSQESKTDFVPLRETTRVQSAPVSQKHSPVQESNHVGLKYLGLAFNTLGISNELPALDDDCCTDHLSCPDGVSRQLKQSRVGALNPTEQSQSQHAPRRLQMGEASVYAGRPSAYENSFYSCDLKSLVSEWSVNSGSTFNTRDEQEFRNGLAALDASIASLQRTLKADLKR
ncbi:coiled-coil domain-containing protein 14 isoform X1 [Clarias gariepinus]|uniref:coiled-coil domain-containing protein 14 isoform X1 n=1 Tax=Clarias gariepinus TaxID=13013 RepID=UPI00234D91E3|nr:coiled-coil domain-containing protein 14 isoform X1 [Clarias gariepinus]